VDPVNKHTDKACAKHSVQPRRPCTALPVHLHCLQQLHGCSGAAEGSMLFTAPKSTASARRCTPWMPPPPPLRHGTATESMHAGAMLCA